METPGLKTTAKDEVYFILTWSMESNGYEADDEGEQQDATLERRNFKEKSVVY